MMFFFLKQKYQCMSPNCQVASLSVKSWNNMEFMLEKNYTKLTDLKLILMLTICLTLAFCEKRHEEQIQMTDEIGMETHGNFRLLGYIVPEFFSFHLCKSTRKIPHIISNTLCLPGIVITSPKTA